ncbi:MAG: hypothetical protein WB680_00720 [Candidatus Acidiferrales bacterium]
MQRSRTQIATSYAPGALFTYEGGLGCCVSVAISTPVNPSSPAVQKQMFEHLSEYVESWFQRAANCRQVPQVLPEQCIDGAFLNHQNEPSVDPGNFTLNQPSRIGFVPDPLVFVCSDCGLLTEFDDVEDLYRRWPQAESRTDCPHGAPSRHNWRQIDVIYAHWSGNYAGLSPHRWLMAPDGRVNKVKRCSNCGHGEYRLVTKGSPFFSDWRFQCVQCATAKEVVQADRQTLELLKPRMDAGHGNLPKEWNMLPVSYRASSVFYPQTDSFILFKDAEATGLLAAARRSDLIQKLMKLYDFPGVPLTHDDVVKQLEENGRNAEASTYKQLVDVLNALPLPAMKSAIEAELSKKRKGYEDQGLIRVVHQQSTALSSQVELNQEWARRYNPVRLAVEHDSFCSEVVKREGTNPNLPAISIVNPEVCNIDPTQPDERRLYVTAVEKYMRRLGLDELVFLRGLDICEFSFGFTRVSSTPSTKEKDLEMPVKLCAFDHVERNKRPIYLLEQKNEGFYLHLIENRVVEWLTKNGLGDRLPPRDGMRIGGLLIEEYQDFGRFLENYRERSSPRTPRSVPNYVYLLLHTMAHHFAQAVVEFSGLEHGSIGEYIFPADLAFLVYRKGMTPDLGNLSAMWRNQALGIFERLLSDRTLKCDSGTLCDQRGGACPACIMAPEVTCIAGNNLLSRAALNGGMPPGWDADRSELTGFLRI